MIPKVIGFGPSGEVKAREEIEVTLKAIKEYLERYVLPHIKGESLEMIKRSFELV